MTPERLAEALAEHEYLGENQTGRIGCQGCTWSGPTSAGIHADLRRSLHRAHVATDVLLPLVREAEAEAWDECVEEVATISWLPEASRALARDANPYRARAEEATDADQ